MNNMENFDDGDKKIFIKEYSFHVIKINPDNSFLCSLKKDTAIVACTQIHLWQLAKGDRSSSDTIIVYCGTAHHLIVE